MIRLALPAPLQKLWAVSFIRFLFVGGLNTIFGYGAFAVFVLMGLHYVLAALFSTVLGVLFNFKTTGTIVFKNRDNRLILRFFGVYRFTYVLNVGLLKIFKELGVHVLITAAVFTVPMAMVAFLLMRLLVFRQSEAAVKADLLVATRELANLLRDLFMEPTGNTVVQFFRYLVVGGAAFIVDFGILYGLTHYGGLYYLTSATLAFLVGLGINYTFSVLWVFSHRVIGNRWVEFGLFALVGVLGLGLNDLSMWLLTSVAGLYYLYSKLITTALVFVWNFAIRKVSLFR